MEYLNAYKKILQQSKDVSLRKAIEYLLKNKVVKNFSDIAKKTNISSSTLTGYMNGKKKISKSFQNNFEELFGLDLTNPVSFEEDSIFDNLAISGLPDVPAVTYLIAYRTFQKHSRAQQAIIEGLKKTNEGLMAANEELYNFILTHDKTLAGKLFKLAS